MSSSSSPFKTRLLLQDSSNLFLPYWHSSLHEHLPSNFCQVNIKSGRTSLRPLNSLGISFEEKKGEQECLFGVEVVKLENEKDIKTEFIKEYQKKYNKENLNVVLFSLEEITDGAIKNANKIFEKFKVKTGINDICFLIHSKNDVGKLYSSIEEGFFQMFKVKLSSEFNKKLLSLSSSLDQLFSDTNTFSSEESILAFLKLQFEYMENLNAFEFWEEIKKLCLKNMRKSFSIYEKLGNKFIFSDPMDMKNFNEGKIYEKINKKEISKIEVFQYICYNYIKACRFLKDYKTLVKFISYSLFSLFTDISINSFDTIFHNIYFSLLYIKKLLEYIKSLRDNIISEKDAEIQEILAEGQINLIMQYKKYLDFFGVKSGYLEEKNKKKLYVFLNGYQWSKEGKNIKNEIEAKLNEDPKIPEENIKSFSDFKNTINTLKMSNKLLTKKSFFEEYYTILSQGCKNCFLVLKTKNYIRVNIELVVILVNIGKFEECKKLVLDMLENKNIRKFNLIYEYLCVILIFLISFISEKTKENLEIMFNMIKVKFSKPKSILNIFNCENLDLINELITTYINTFFLPPSSPSFSFSLNDILNIHFLSSFFPFEVSSNSALKIPFELTNVSGLNFGVKKAVFVFVDEYEKEKKEVEIESDKIGDIMGNIKEEKKDAEINIDKNNNNSGFEINSVYRLIKIKFVLKNGIEGNYILSEKVYINIKSMNISVESNILPSYEDIKNTENEFYYNVLSLLYIKISGISDIKELSDKSITFHILTNINSQESEFKLKKHEFVEKYKEKFDFDLIEFSSEKITFLPGSIKDINTLNSLYIPFTIENINFYSSSNFSLILHTSLHTNSTSLFSYKFQHFLKLTHLFNISKKFRTLENGSYLMQSTFSLNIEKSNLKVYMFNESKSVLNLDMMQAVNLILCLPADIQCMKKELEKNYLRFSIGEDKYYNLCYPENSIIEEIKEIKNTPYHIILSVEEKEYKVFSPVEIEIKIKKKKEKNVTLMTHILDSENWTIIGKSKLVSNWDKEKEEETQKFKILPLVDGYLKIPEVEFLEYEIEEKENEDNIKNKFDILNGKVEFEPIEYGSIVEGNEKVVKIEPNQDIVLRLNLT